jgi:hypothetical protein
MDGSVESLDEKKSICQPGTVELYRQFWSPILQKHLRLSIHPIMLSIASNTSNSFFYEIGVFLAAETNVTELQSFD